MAILDNVKKTSSGAAGSGAATRQKTPISALEGTEPIYSYEQFLRDKERAYAAMRETTAFYDKQSQETLAAIEAQRQAATATGAQKQTMEYRVGRDEPVAQNLPAQAGQSAQATLLSSGTNASSPTSALEGTELIYGNYENFLRNKSAYTAVPTEAQNQNNMADTAATEQNNAATTYANTQYQTLVDAINAQKESGIAMAEEQLQILLNMSEEQRNIIYAAAESQRLTAERRADVERERGVVDARSSYEQNKASYGANAEAIGSMGLSGSGYSDYLNSKAYAQQRAETQEANARSDTSKREARYAEDQARLQADSDYYKNKQIAEQAYFDRLYEIDTTYHNNMLKVEQEEAKRVAEEEKRVAEEEEKKASYARAAYTELLSGANSGTYTVAQLEQLSADYGLSDAQKLSLITAANDYTARKQAEASAEIYNSSGYAMGAIDSAQQAGAISAEQAAKQKAQIQNQNYEIYASEVSYGNADTSTIDRAYQRGDISESQYNDLKAKWNNNIDTSADFFYSDNTMLTKSAAQKALNNLTKNPWFDSSLAPALQAEFDKLYTPRINGSNYNASEKELADVGNNFKVTLNNKKYHVESAGECTDTNVKEVAADVGDGSMFGYQGHVYIKSNGKIYEIRKRKNTFQSDWTAVYSALCG